MAETNSNNAILEAIIKSMDAPGLRTMAEKLLVAAAERDMNAKNDVVETYRENIATRTGESLSEIKDTNVEIIAVRKLVQAASPEQLATFKKEITDNTEALNNLVVAINKQRAMTGEELITADAASRSVSFEGATLDEIGGKLTRSTEAVKLSTERVELKNQQLNEYKKILLQEGSESGAPLTDDEIKKKLLEARGKRNDDSADANSGSEQNDSKLRDLAKERQEKIAAFLEQAGAFMMATNVPEGERSAAIEKKLDEVKDLPLNKIEQATEKLRDETLVAEKANQALREQQLAGVNDPSKTAQQQQQQQLAQAAQTQERDAPEAEASPLRRGWAAALAALNDFKIPPGVGSLEMADHNSIQVAAGGVGKTADQQHSV